MNIHIKAMLNAKVWLPGIVDEVMRVGEYRPDGTVDIPDSEWRDIERRFRLEPQAIQAMQARIAAMGGCCGNQPDPNAL